jgi:NhaP-type Na+/H+ or K+/H+ antiporter
MNQNILIAGLIFLVWVLLLVITILTKLIVFEVMLPLVSLIFGGFLIFITIRTLLTLNSKEEENAPK